MSSRFICPECDGPIVLASKREDTGAPPCTSILLTATAFPIPIAESIAL